MFEVAEAASAVLGGPVRGEQIRVSQCLAPLGLEVRLRFAFERADAFPITRQMFIEERLHLLAKGLTLFGVRQIHKKTLIADRGAAIGQPASWAIGGT